MARISRLHIVVIVLCLFGVVFFSLRGLFSSDESLPVGDSLWQITINIALKKPTSDNKLHIFIPSDTGHLRVVGQHLFFPDFKLWQIGQYEATTRQLIVMPRFNAAELRLSSEFDIQLSKFKRWPQRDRSVSAGEEQLSKYLSLAEIETSVQSQVMERLNRLRGGVSSNTDLLQKVFSDVHNEAAAQANIEAKNRSALALSKANLMIELLRSAAIPARLVSGIVIDEQIALEEHYWIEAYIQEQWQSFDPVYGYSRQVPSNYLRLAVDTTSLAFTDDGTPVEVSIDAIQQPALAGRLSSGQKKFVDVIDLTRLSLDTQFLLVTILLLPIAALITTAFHSVVGVRSYGTFTPALIAMTIIHAEWFTVIAVAMFVILFGLISRKSFPEKIGKVPRLSLLFSLVALSIVFSVSLMDYFNLNPDAKVVLLPIIVFTNLVDRFYTTFEEKGTVSAVYRLLWTIIITLVCVFFFSLQSLQDLVLNYPEIHCFVMATILLLAAYKGRKLSQRPAWSWLQEPVIKPSTVEEVKTS